MGASHEIKALIFDLGNTLLYFDGNWSQAMQMADRELLAALQQAGLNLQADLFLPLFRKRLNEYYKKREIDHIENTSASILISVLAELGFSNVNEKLLESALTNLYLVSQAHWKAEKGSVTTLKTLQNLGYRLAVLSNASNDADVQTLVDKAKFRPFLDFVLSSAACGIRKPDPRIFDIALANWDFAPEQVAMVGDTLKADIRGANRAGMFSIWLTRRVEHPTALEQFENIHPDKQIDALNDLVNLLQSG